MQAQKMKYRNVLSGYNTAGSVAADDEAHVSGVAALPAANVLVKHKTAVSAEQLSSLSRLESMLCPHSASAQSSLLMSEHATRRHRNTESHTEARAATARLEGHHHGQSNSHAMQLVNPYTPTTLHPAVPQPLILVPQSSSVVSTPQVSATREGCYVQYLEDEVDILTRQQSDACRLVVRVTAEKDRAWLVSAEMRARYALVEDEHDSFLNLLWLSQSLAPHPTVAMHEVHTAKRALSTVVVSQRAVGVGTSACQVQQSSTQTNEHEVKAAATQTVQADESEQEGVVTEEMRQAAWQRETARLVAAAVQDALRAASKLHEESAQRWQLFCDAVEAKRNAVSEQLALLRDVQQARVEQTHAATLHALQDELTQLREVNRSLHVKLRESERSAVQLAASEMSASMSVSHVNSSGTSASAAKYAGVSGLYIPSKLQASLAPARRSLEEMRKEAATLGVRPVVVPHEEDEEEEKAEVCLTKVAATTEAGNAGKESTPLVVAAANEQNKSALPAVQNLPRVRRVTLDVTSSSSSTTSRVDDAQASAMKPAVAAQAEPALAPVTSTTQPQRSAMTAKLRHVRSFSESGSVTSQDENAGLHHTDSDSSSDLSLASTTTRKSTSASSSSGSHKRGHHNEQRQHEHHGSSQPTTTNTTTTTTTTLKRRSSFDEDDVGEDDRVGTRQPQANKAATTVSHANAAHPATLPHIDARALSPQSKTRTAVTDKTATPKHRLQLPSW